MSNMKNFAIWLAKCIYERRLTEEEIWLSAKAAWGICSKIWLIEQIEAIKKNPTYKELSHHE